MKKLFGLILVSILLISGIVFADGNGIWHLAKDVRGGTFGSDEGGGDFVFSDNLEVNGNLEINGTHIFYANSATGVRLKSNHDTVTFFNLRDRQETNYGWLYGSGDGMNFGLLDGDGHWNYLHRKDSYTAFRINDDEKLRINSAGNVGIGTTTPSQKLDVVGNVEASGFCIGSDCITDWADISSGGGGAAAWVTWTRSGGIQDGSGVASVTLNGNNRPVVTFSSPMSNNKYAVVCSGYLGGPTSAPNTMTAYSKTTSKFDLYGAHASGEDRIDGFECAVFTGSVASGGSTTVAWTDITGMPAGFADGTDDGGSGGGGAAAWVNFDGTTGNIRSQNNVASVTRVSVGRYRINFATPMPHANYAVSWSSVGNLGNENHHLIALTTNYVEVELIKDTTAAERRDTSIGTVAVFTDSGAGTNLDIVQTTASITSCGGAATATCPAGYTIVGGGFELTDGNCDGSHDRLGASHPVGTNSWRAYYYHGKGVVHAVCAKGGSSGGSGSVAWADITGMPAGFADGTDNEGSGGACTFSAESAWSACDASTTATCSYSAGIQKKTKTMTCGGVSSTIVTDIKSCYINIFCP